MLSLLARTVTNDKVIPSKTVWFRYILSVVIEFHYHGYLEQQTSAASVPVFKYRVAGAIRKSQWQSATVHLVRGPLGARSTVCRLETFQRTRKTTAPGFRIVIQEIARGEGGSHIRGGLCIWLGAGWLATIPLCTIPFLLFCNSQHAKCNFCFRQSRHHLSFVLSLDKWRICNPFDVSSRLRHAAVTIPQVRAHSLSLGSSTVQCLKKTCISTRPS
jgi:hypothetical protein